MQYEKMAKLAEYNAGEKSEIYLNHLHQQIVMQMSYNVGSLTESLSNAKRAVKLSSEVFKDKDSEIKKIPIINTLFEA